MTRISRALAWLLLAMAVAVGSPAVADTYYGYSQGGIPLGADIFTWCDTPPCDLSEPVVCASPEGGSAFRMNTNVWGGWGVFMALPGAELVDLSSYGTGDLRFFVKSGHDLKVEFQCRPTGFPPDVSYTTFIADHGWDGTNTWQEIVVPISSFFAPNPVDAACLANVYSPFLATIENLPFFNSFQIDFIRWQTSNSHSGASDVGIQGRQLTVDAEPFVVKAVGYSPIGVGDNWQSAWRDRPDRYLVDFPLIAASGANTVRLYAPILTTAMLDAAWAEGLYVIPTYGVDSVQLTCPDGKAFMQDRFVDYVEQWKDHPAILSWMIGNEVNRNLVPEADLCVDWYPQLDAMALAAHTAEGTAFHPIGTATADVGQLSDVCIPTCSDDLALPNVDLWGVQIYRGCSFGSAFTDYENKASCDRPLLVTEFGADAFDGTAGVPAEDQTMQADCMETLLTEADQALAVRTAGGVSSGQVIFSWSDEWWKSDCDPGNAWTTHDTCTSFTNTGYPDSTIQEEWWGITTLDPAAPDTRGLRTSHDRVAESYLLGAACDQRVVSYDNGTGNTDITFAAAAGSTEHTLYYGPLNAVSTYGYTGSVSGLGATGSSSLTLPSGDLFWVIAARDNGAEGCYGTDSAGGERPASSGSSLPPAANRNCGCGVP